MVLSTFHFDISGNAINDESVYNSSLTDLLNKRNVLLLGPGSSIVDCAEELSEMIINDKLVVVSVNFYPKDFPIDCVFMSNNKRYAFLSDYLGEDEKINARFIATSNVHIVDLKPDYTLNFESLLIPQLDNTDNALVLLLSFLVKAGVKAVSLAGFDGYKVNENNYYRKGYEVAVDNIDNANRNETMSNALRFFKDKINITFITPTQYTL